jgi:hypothetical protein
LSQGDVVIPPANVETPRNKVFAAERACPLGWGYCHMLRPSAGGTRSDSGRRYGQGRDRWPHGHRSGMWPSDHLRVIMGGVPYLMLAPHLIFAASGRGRPLAGFPGHCNEREDCLSDRLRQRRPACNHCLEVGGDCAPCRFRCCPRCCPLILPIPEVHIVCKVAPIRQVTHNPWVGGSTPSGPTMAFCTVSQAVATPRIKPLPVKGCGLGCESLRENAAGCCTAFCTARAPDSAPLPVSAARR